MRLLRSALSGIFFVAYGLAALPFAPILMLPGWTPKATRRVIRWFYRAFVRSAAATGLYRVAIDGPTAAALERCRGRIVVMNHVSLIDICILVAHLADSSVVVKASALRNPFLGMAIRKAFIPNSDDAMEVTRKVRAALLAGVNVIVFPEGTRRRPDATEHPMHRGAARLALSSGVPVSCFHIDYDPLPLAKNQPWWDVGNREIVIQLTFKGEVLPTGESDHRHAVELTKEIKERIL